VVTALVSSWLVIAVLPGLPAVAQETQDAKGSLFLDGLATTTAVGTQVQFAASLTNDGPGAAVGIRTLISVTLPEAGPQEIRVERREFDGSWATIGTKIGTKGEVKLVDDSTTDLWVVAGGVLTGRYRLTFLQRTPSGDAVVVAEVQHRVGREWRSLARSPQYLTKVLTSTGVGSAGAPVTPFTPAPTLSVEASPIVVDGDVLGNGSDDGAGEGKLRAAPWLLSSRLGVGLCIIGVLGMLAVAAWVLRREVMGGPVSERGGDGM
jgi:hypothetical protein